MPAVGEITARGMRFEWKITHFLKKLERSRRDYISSPSYRYEGTDWYLAVRVLDIKDPKPFKDICLFICRENDNYPESVNVSIGLCRRDGSEGKASNGTAEFAKHRFYWGPFKFYSDMEKLLEPEGTITVYCYLKKNQVEEDDSDSDSEESSDEEEDLRAIKAECCASLCEDMKKLYHDKMDCDVDLVVGEMSFSAHSSILSCRSVVFYRKLKNHAGYLVLEDCEPHIFTTFLEYLYVGRVEDPSPRDAFKLYRQAYLYKISPLKKQCLEVLHPYLSLDTLCDVLRYAKKYSVTDIFKEAMKLLVDNYRDILNSKEWIQLLEEDPVIGNEIMKEMVRILKNSYKVQQVFLDWYCRQILLRDFQIH